MSKYDYVERAPWGGWLMEVRKGQSHKGNIRKNPVTGRYQFYRGSRNATRPMLEDVRYGEAERENRGSDL